MTRLNTRLPGGGQGAHWGSRPVRDRRRKRLGGLSRSERALLAGQLRSAGLSPHRAANVTRTRLSDGRIASSATPAELAALRSGALTIEKLRAQRSRHPTDRALDRSIERIGLGRVLDAIDRLTAPALRVAAE